MKGSLNLDVFVQDKGLKKRIRNSVRLYRYVASKVFSALAMSWFAGSVVETKGSGDLVVSPRTREGHEILQRAMGNYRKAMAYPCRKWVLDELAPTWHSFVWDSVRRDVSSRWNAKDPEFTSVTRGWLVLQGARSIARFSHLGIGIPKGKGRRKFEGRTFTVMWDREIGEVTFKLARLDAGRFFAWRKVSSGEWEPGTIYLNERDGDLRITITYDRPDEKADLDPDAVMEVFLPDESSCDIRIKTGGDPVILSTEAAAMHLARLRKQMQRREAEKAAAGSPVREWGSRKIFKAVQERLHRITVRRSRLCSDWNHQWSRRIEREATRARCGKVVLKGPSKEGGVGKSKRRDVTSTVGGESWPWEEFVKDCSYKLARRGATLDKEYEVVQGSPSNPKGKP